MADMTNLPGCGRPLQSTHADGSPQALPCGQRDDFGKLQYCHSCNASIGAYPRAVRETLTDPLPRAAEGDHA